MMGKSSLFDWEKAVLAGKSGNAAFRIWPFCGFSVMFHHWKFLQMAKFSAPDCLRKKERAESRSLRYGTASAGGKCIPYILLYGIIKNKSMDI